MYCSVCKLQMQRDFVSATGTDGDYMVELRKVPAFRCPSAHETKAPNVRFESDLMSSLEKSVLIGKGDNDTDPHSFNCPNCGHDAANMTVGRAERDVQIQIPSV